MKFKQLFVVGELNVDLILNDINGFPEVGKEIIADHLSLVLGSSSAILASNAASLGLKTSFCGTVGKDTFGDRVLNELQKNNVDTQYIKVLPEKKTGITVVLNYDQERANVTHCGAMEALRIEDIPWDAVARHKHFHLSNFFLQKGIKDHITAIFKKAKNAGVTTSLDMQWDPSNRWEFNYKECLPFVDVFFPNEAEIKALTGTHSVEDALEKITPFANTIALKRGENGSLGVQNDLRIPVAAYTAPHFKDAIGAGDSFNAGFLHEYLNGKSLRNCLGYGNLMGALNTTASGGTAAFNDIDTLKKNIHQLIHSS